MTATGSCLCGEVAYKYDGRFENFFLCHCKYCRKDSGSAHTANLFGKGGELVWLRGRDKVSSFILPHTRHQRSFCKQCGSALPYDLNEGDQFVVPAGSLDTDVGLVPQGHIFMASKANWDAGLHDVACFAKLPS